MMKKSVLNQNKYPWEFLQNSLYFKIFLKIGELSGRKKVAVRVEQIIQSLLVFLGSYQIFSLCKRQKDHSPFLSFTFVLFQHEAKKSDLSSSQLKPMTDL